jgi:hypothetical protein
MGGAPQQGQQGSPGESLAGGACTGLPHRGAPLEGGQWQVPLAVLDLRPQLAELTVLWDIVQLCPGAAPKQYMITAVVTNRGLFPARCSVMLCQGRPGTRWALTGALPCMWPQRSDQVGVLRGSGAVMLLYQRSSSSSVMGPRAGAQFRLQNCELQPGGVFLPPVIPLHRSSW